MATRVPARLTPADGRRFGFTVGAAFVAIGGVAWWRGHALAAPVLAGLGLALITGALIAPARLGPVYRKWMGLATALSSVTTPIVLGVIYFTVLTPTGVLRRILGRNAIARPRSARGFWVAREPGMRSRGDMHHQF